MLDILQLRIRPEEFDQLGICQVRRRADCHAAFTVSRGGVIWPVASWGDTPAQDRLNVRGWFPLLDKIADELLLWWPQGGCCFISRESVTYHRMENDTRGVLFLQLEHEQHRLSVVPPRQLEPQRIAI